MNPAGSFRRIYEALDKYAKVADPGNAGTIRVDRDRMYVPIVTAAAETRTLAVPEKEGVLCTLAMTTDGGDCTVTVTSGYNEAGSTSIVFSDAGQYVTFESVAISASAYRWRVLGADHPTVGSLSAISTHLLSTQAQVNVPLYAILAAGTPMAAWADNASSNPGITLANSEAFGIRWNNNASQTAVWLGVAMPQDLDDTAAVVMHILASKTGATVGDATTFTVTGFFQTVGALHDADADVGGASSAMTGDATAKTVQELTLSIAAGDVPPSPSHLSFSIKPTDGTLGTDDVIVHAIWLEYTRKLLTA